MRGDDGEGGRWCMWAQKEVVDGYTSSSHVPRTQRTGTPAPETQRAGEPTAPRRRSLYRYLPLHESRRWTLGWTRQSPERRERTAPIVQLTLRGILCGNWAGDGGMGITGGSMSRSNIADEDECLGLSCQIGL